MSVLKPRTATKVLYQGDDMSSLSELKRALDQADRALLVAEAQQGSTAARMGDDEADTPTAAQQARDEAQAAYDAGVGEAADRAVEVVLQSIGSRRFRDLVAEHEPRMVDGEPDDDGKVEKVEHPDDAGWGVNVETFPRAILAYRDGEFRTIGAPALSNGDLAAFIDDELAEGDLDELWQAAFLLNRVPSADPKAWASAATTSASPSTPAT